MIYFLLLIYFLVATEFQTTEAAFSLDLPQRQHSHHLSIDDEPIVVVVESYGDSLKDMQLHVKEPWGPVHTIGALQKFLHENQITEFGSSGMFTNDHPMHIQPTTTTRWDHVLSVYNAILQVKYNNIHLDDPS